MTVASTPQRDPFVITSDELSSGADSLLHHLGRDRDILALDERSLAMASCLAVRHGARVFVPRARDYGLPHVPLPDGTRLHGVGGGTRLAVLSCDMNAAARTSAAVARHIACVVHLPTLEGRGGGVVGNVRSGTASPSSRAQGSADLVASNLERSIDGCPVVRYGDYHYFVHPLSDGVPYIDGALLSEAAGRMARVLPDCDRLVTAVTMGVPLAASLAMLSGRPMAMALKSDPGVHGRARARQTTGYSTGDLYLGGIARGERVTIVDDVLSTGGTAGALVEAVRGMGGEVESGIFLFNKIRDWKSWAERSGMRVFPVFHVEVVDGRAVRTDWG